MEELVPEVQTLLWFKNEWFFLVSFFSLRMKCIIKNLWSLNIMREHLFFRCNTAAFTDSLLSYPHFGAQARKEHTQVILAASLVSLCPLQPLTLSFSVCIDYLQDFLSLFSPITYLHPRVSSSHRSTLFYCSLLPLKERSFFSEQKSCPV